MTSNLVVAGCVKDEVQGPEAGHKLSVYPELVEGAQLLVDHGVAHGDKKGQGEIKRLQTCIILLCVELKIALPRIQMIGKQTVSDLWQG